MAGVVSLLRPGYALQNRAQKPKVSESKTARYSPPGIKYTTSYREEFCKWQTPKKTTFKPSDNLTQSDAKFQDMMTSYQAEYGFKTPGPARAPENQYLQTAIPFALQYALKPTQPSKLQMTIYSPNTAIPLGGDTDSVSSKPKREQPSSVSPPKAGRDLVGGAASRAFTHSTEYSDNYRAWPTPPVYKRAYPTYDPPKGTMQFVTSYASDYRPWGNQTRRPIIQKMESVWPKGSFQHTTTYLQDFTPKVATPARTRPAQRR